MISDNERDKHVPAAPDAVETEPSVDGPLRHFRAGRRALLQSLATGVGAAVLASPALASAQVHHHHAAAPPAKPADPTTETTAAPALLFLDLHAFDTLAILGEQIVPGSRASKVPEFLDRLLAVESTQTQKLFTQALGAFEHEARAVHGKPWKALTAPQATALLTKVSTQPRSDAKRQAFEGIKVAVAETYFSSEAGLKELGWNGSLAFASPMACG